MYFILVFKLLGFVTDNVPARGSTGLSSTLMGLQWRSNLVTELHVLLPFVLQAAGESRMVRRTSVDWSQQKSFLSHLSNTAVNRIICCVLLLPGVECHSPTHLMMDTS